MKISRLITLLILLSFHPLKAEYQLGEHPRIFINKEILPALAEKVRSGGLLADDYAMIKAEADRVVEEGSLRAIDNEWIVPVDMLSACLAFLVERELGNQEAGEYAEVVKNLWGDGMLTLSTVGNGHFGSYAIAYDWIYDALTPEERKKFGDILGGWLYHYTSTPEIVLLWGGWLMNQTWGPAHLNRPNCRDGITPKLFVSLALSRAGTIHEDACRRYLDSWEQRVTSECMPLFDRMGGVWSESMGHGNYGPVKVIPWAFEAWRTATGLDWFALGCPTSFLKEMNRWAVHLSVPFNDYTAPIDDNNGALLTRQWGLTAPILGARYKDPVANYLSRGYDRGSWPDKWYQIPWVRFITHDPDVAANPPGAVGWPTARLFTGAGHVYMRSAWDDPNATWAFFGVGPSYATHSRDDEGHFLIAKKGWLVLQAGGQGHNDDDYYIGGSLAYNIVTVFDPDEQYRRTSPSEDALAAGGTKNERDGGTIRYVYQGPHDTIYERGQITAFKHTSKYTYAAANLTEAYRKTKVNEITRQFLYLRGEHEFFVIFDRIDAKKGEFPKHWFLHIPTEPVVDGIETELTAGHVYSYSEAAVSSWLSDPAGFGNVLSTGRSRAFLKCVLPHGAVIVKRGGDGHQFWGHPNEPTAQYNHIGRSSLKTPIVPWRLEVKAPVGQTRDYFLHVLELGDEHDIEMSEVELIEQDTTLVGVRIAAQGGEPLEILFACHGELSAQVKFSPDDQFEQLTDVISLILRGRYQPDDQTLDFNGDGVYSLADAVGLLYYIWEVAQGSLLASVADSAPLALTADERSYFLHALKQLSLTDSESKELMSLVSLPEEPRALALYQNSPNPLNPSTTISYAIPESTGLQTRLEIFNLRGQIVRMLVNKFHQPGVYQLFWDGTDNWGRKVPSGVYLYMLRTGSLAKVRKMIVLR